MAVLTISRVEGEAMTAHARREHPNEACGLLAGRAGRVLAVYPVANRLARPDAYEMEPAEQVAAMLDLEARGLELLALYHSHPDGPAAPSATDLAQWHYPDAAMVIISLSDGERPEVRAYALAGGRVAETRLRVQRDA